MQGETETFATPWLEPGGHVRIVAPSSPFRRDDFERGVAHLRTRFRVSYAEDILERQGYLAGADARRLEELAGAIEDPDVDAIVAARGGYGATRLLDGLDIAKLRLKPKLLVGFSDITALHALWASARIASLHGPMVAKLGTLTEPLVTRHLEALEGRGVGQVDGLQAVARGHAQGTLLGGNLTMLCALLGTPHMPVFDDAVLFLEDIGERPYRLDRMLTSLRASGALQGVRAVLLGAFEQAEPGPDGVLVTEVLAERLSDLGIPVLAGLSSGHVDDNLELPFGTRVFVDGATGTLTFQGRSQA